MSVLVALVIAVVFILWAEERNQRQDDDADRRAWGIREWRRRFGL